ncbi:hypothetical protein [Rhodococcus sp. AG1013]|uniref:hypothetical protein n=1 Tax=Rhodococcus sp. AG1013 TaxID=2183996 RepID=UPI00215D6404|nr:hypothetical protein [Rhodococcus sp. AG1013]
MAGRWSGRFFGESRDEDEAMRRARETMTAAFLDLDGRQRIAESSVAASNRLYPDKGIHRQWQSVRDGCYEVGSRYVATCDDADSGRATVTDLDATTRALIDAAHLVDEFYGSHRAHLEHAASLLDAIPRIAVEAQSAADAACRSAVGPYAGYSSVRAGVAAIDEASLLLAGAGAQDDIRRVRDAAARLNDAVAELGSALAAAPDRERQARNALSSVTTRIAAVRNRAADLGPAYSSILREFNAASSDDLVGNDRESVRLIEQSEVLFAEAQAALAAGDPDLASELTARVRATLVDAEGLVDAVTDRLRLLRDVRTDPRAKVDAVRFRLRDAQLLAVNSGLAVEWGSALDAQVDRIERAVDRLAGTHPDYWAYITELDAVSSFVAGIVQRMRGQSATP